MNGTALTLDLVATSGVYGSLANELRYRIGDGLVGDRVTLGLDVAFSFIPRVLFNIGASGSLGFGCPSGMGAGNEVIGWGPSLEATSRVRIGIRGFVGFPVANSIELLVLNLVVIQSINAGLVYEGATAFDDAKTVVHRMQHAVGIEVLPVIRTFRDTALSLGIGLSCNLGRIAADPTEPGSYAPSLFIDVSFAPRFYSAAVAY